MTLFGGTGGEQLIMTVDNAQMISLREKEWPSGMQPSVETIKIADYVWELLGNAISHDKKLPNISAADDSSIDFFWGSKRERILLNVKAGQSIYINYITDNDMTTLEMALGHFYPVGIPFLRSLGYV